MVGRNYVMPTGTFINKDCKGCYFKNKAETQKSHIINSQEANKRYKREIEVLQQRIEQKDCRIEQLRKDNRDWYKAFDSLPYLIKRWVWWHYSRMR